MAPTTTKPVCRPMRSTSRTSSPESSAMRLGVHRAADIEGGEHGATGVILVGERRAEQRHEAVAEELVHRAFVAMHLRERGLEEAAQKRVHAVGADPLGEGGGADEIAEEHGDGLALALHGGAGGEDLLGEMPGRVGLRRGARGRGGGRLDPGAAARAEARALGERGPTRGAMRAEPSAARDAKSCARRAFLLAARTGRPGVNAHGRIMAFLPRPPRRIGQAPRPGPSTPAPPGPEPR